MGNSKELDDFCLDNCELVIDKVKTKIGLSSDSEKKSINSQTSIESEESSGKRIFEEENNKSEPEEILDEESIYFEDSFCSDRSSESEPEMTDVTPRSLLSASSSLPYGPREKGESAVMTKFTNDDDDEEIYELTDDMRYLSMDDFERISSSQQRCHYKRKNMTFTNEELMKIERDNKILLQRIMKFQRPLTKSKVKNVQPRLSSSAINRRKVQRQIEEDNMLLLRKIQHAKPHILPRAKSAAGRLKYN